MTELKNGSALVVGASLAGLMTGIALARAGLRVTILERTGPTPRNGAVLQVDSGHHDKTRTAAVLRQLASGGMQSAEAWSSVQARLRADIDANPAITLRFDTHVMAIGQDDDAAWVKTSRGEILRGDLLIGADGHRSLVRAQVAPHNPDARFAGYLIWLALLDEQVIANRHRPGTQTAVTTMLSGRADNFLLGSVVAGADGSKAPGHRRLGWAWYDNTRNGLLRQQGCVTGTVVHHSLTGPAIPQQTLTELAREASARWPQPWLDATLHSIQTRDLIAIPIAEYVADRLVNGRLTLVGDAAHVLTPITASGFNASLQDAATLADCLTGRAGAVEALSAYETQRLPVVRQLVQSGQSFSRSFGR